MKDILIIANFTRDFSISDNGRFMYLCKELSKCNMVEIITSNFNHSDKKHKSLNTIKWPFKITFLHENGYLKNISLKRFYSHFLWGIEVKKYIQKRNKPDVIYCAVPSLTAALVTARYAEKYNVKFIIDIQDLWPEAFHMVLKLPLISNMLFFPIKVIANHIYKKADCIIAVSNTYLNRALSVSKKCNCGLTVFIGTRLETFDDYTKGEPVIKKRDDEVWIGYCGSLSTSYDIPTLIASIMKLKEKNLEGLKLIIMGDGTKKTQFELIASESGISYIFTGRIAYQEMCATLKQCDIVVNPIKGGSAASIINKHADYAASALPVINTQESHEYRELVDNYQMGFNCINGDIDDMAEKLEILVSNEKLRKKMGRNARRCAEDNFDRKNSYKKILNCIEQQNL